MAGEEERTHGFHASKDKLTYAAVSRIATCKNWLSAVEPLREISKWAHTTSGWKSESLPC
jgi:hypothetical protein